jgi:hypothetical protein
MRRTHALIAAILLLALIPAAAEEESAVVSWNTLAQVSVTRHKDRFVAQFSEQILALDKREVKLKGFMMPLERGLAQKHFLLTMERPDGDFCGNAEQFAEVLAKEPVKVPSDAIVVSGTFSLVQNDSGELLYRLNDAVIVNK